MRLARTIVALALICGIVSGVVAANGRETQFPAHTVNADAMVAKAAAPIDPESHPGRTLFAEHCATCHAGGIVKAPAVVWLKMMAPDAILGAMRGGIMSQQAAGLSAQQQDQVAEYLTGIHLADFKRPAPPPVCVGKAADFSGAPPALVSWGHDNRRFIPENVGDLNASDFPKLKLKWAFAYPNAVRARSQPAVGWNTIFVGSHDGTVYAFDIVSGCTKWTFRATAEIRDAIVIDPEHKRVYFGDVLGRVYALDAMTGRVLWRTKVEDHPNGTITGSVTLGGGALFVPISSLEVTSAANPQYACCTFRGAVVALNAASGSVKWKAYTVPNPPREQGKTSVGTPIFGPSGAPVWGAPTFDAKRNRVYFGSGENYASPADGNSDALFAVDATTGVRVWVRQLTAMDAWNVGCMISGNPNCPKENGPDFDIASSPLLIDLGKDKDIIVAGQKSGYVFGIDPTTGAVVWKQRLGHGGTQGGVHFGMSAEGTTVYVPIVDMADTFDNRTYDVSVNGAGIHALDAATGNILWRHKTPNICDGQLYCDPGVSAATTAIPGAVMAGHLDGWFRVYDKNDGKILWSYDTRQAVKTITGTTTTGGSMSGPGSVAYNGYLIFNSGYGMYFHMAGNALLVFEKQAGR